MKTRLTAIIVIAIGVFAFFSERHLAGKSKRSVYVPYEANWESLKSYQVPKWYRDAKFGIFIHWGPYSVPAFGNEWYPRHMYPWVYDHHIEKYGSPDQFGYKDFIPLFKAEQFNPVEWISLFKKAGARYVIPVAEHHDGFAMYKSQHSNWNAFEMGPKRDVLKELFQEGRSNGLKMGASSHFAFNWGYYNKKETFDTSKPEYEGLYGRPHLATSPPDNDFLKLWWNRTTDIIDNYQPDLLWFDFKLNQEVFRSYHPQIAAYYYNQGLEMGKEVILQNKNFNGFESFPPGTNVLDIERGKLSGISKYPWQTDTSIGKTSWSYTANWESKSANELIDDLVDIVSKNGNLLLNVGPRHDGTIPEDQQRVLLDIGAWLEKNGESIYETRPWVIYGEGPTKVHDGHFTETINTPFTSQDFRFTKKANNLYATALEYSADQAYNIITLGNPSKHLGHKEISSITHLASGTEVPWEQTNEGLTINGNSQIKGEYACVFKIEFK